MPPIDTGLPADYAVPTTSHKFSYIDGGGQLTPLPQTVALLGTMLAPGAAVSGAAGQVYEIHSAEQAGKLFGVGSEVHCMVQCAYLTQRMHGIGPKIVASGALEPAAGAKATFTLTVTGPATEAGNAVIKANGRRFKIGVALNADANAVAQSIVDMFTRHSRELPFTVARVNGVVTATYNHKGTNGNDLAFEVESLPKGIAIAIAAGVAGAGALDLTNNYDALEGIEIDYFAISTRSVDDAQDVLAHVTEMWQPQEKKWRWGIIGDTETLATATALATAANDRAVIVASMQGCPSMPFELATSVAVAAALRARPNAIFNGMNLPIAPPSIADAYNGSEIQTGILAGLTIIVPIQRGQLVVGDRCKIVRMVTTKTTQDALPFLKCRDLGVPRTGAYMARQLDIKYAEQFGEGANPDNALMDEDADDRVRDLVSLLWYEAEQQKILKNVAADLDELKVEPDDEADGRMDVETAMNVVLGMHQVAYSHRVKVGG